MNIRKIADAAGVSTATVSRVLNAQQGTRTAVSEKTRRRVLDTCTRLRYEPNTHAKRIFARKSWVLGVIMPAFGPHQVEAQRFDVNEGNTIAGIMHSCRQMSYNTLLLIADNAFISRREYLRVLRSRMVDGLLIWGACLDEDYIEDLKEETSDFLLVYTHGGHQDVNFVQSDHKAEGKLMCEHLLELGHRRIGFICGPETSTVALERAEGFSSALRAGGVYDSRLIVKGGFAEEDGWRKAQLLIERNSSITAIGCVNDESAMGAFRAMRSRGLRVGKDISIIGADAEYDHQIIRLTTVDPHMFKVGQLSARRLVEHLDAEKRDPDTTPERITITIPPLLVPGETTAPPIA